MGSICLYNSAEEIHVIFKATHLKKEERASSYCQALDLITFLHLWRKHKSLEVSDLMKVAMMEATCLGLWKSEEEERTPLWQKMMGYCGWDSGTFPTRHYPSITRTHQLPTNVALGQFQFHPGEWFPSEPSCSNWQATCSSTIQSWGILLPFLRTNCPQSKGTCSSLWSTFIWWPNWQMGEFHQKVPGCLSFEQLWRTLQGVFGSHQVQHLPQ